MSRFPILVVLVLGVASLVPDRASHAAATIVTCKDGTTATGGRGACHGHGGVDKTAGSTKEPKAAAGTTTQRAGVQTQEAAGEVICTDGTSWPKAGRGACRGHGGVLKPGGAPAPPPMPRAATAPSSYPGAHSATPPLVHSAPVQTRPPAATATATASAPTKAKRASDDPTGANARCKDGMYWHGTQHRGSCSRHGGVAEWLGPS